MTNQISSYLLLLLDDDEDDYILLKSSLQTAFGNAVTLDWYQRNHIAAEMICTVPYAAAFIDYHLGLENGLEILKKVKAQCPDRVIFLFSSWGDKDLSKRAMQARANGFIRKSDLTPELLVKLLSPHLPGLLLMK